MTRLSADVEDRFQFRELDRNFQQKVKNKSSRKLLLKTESSEHWFGPEGQRGPEDPQGVGCVESPWKGFKEYP